MTHGKPPTSTLPQTATARSASLDGEPAQAPPLLTPPVEPVGAGAADSGSPVRSAAAAPANRTTRGSLRSHPSPAPHGVEAAGTTPVSLAARGEKLPHVAHGDRPAKRKAVHPLVLPPATSREIAALASGR